MPSWFGEEPQDWVNQRDLSLLPQEGNLETHVCVKQSLPVFLIAAFLCSTVYLMHACCMPSIEEIPKRKAVVVKNEEKTLK